MKELPTACAGFRHTCSVENAPLFARWIEMRGGVAVWCSLDLSDPGKSWSSPALTPDGQEMKRPSWQAGVLPEAVITDPGEIGVSVDKEVKRFRVAVRMGDQGLRLKCTDRSSDRIRRAVAKAGEGAYHVFDYSTQEAVIMKPEGWKSLAQWIKEQEVKE